MALVISKKPAILLKSDNDSRIVIFEGKTITKSLFADIENCEEFTRVIIPGNVEGIAGDAFEDFVNLREAGIWGYVEGVERSLGTVATLDIDWENPAEFAEHLTSGCYIEIKRRRSWRDWN